LPVQVGVAGGDFRSATQPYGAQNAFLWELENMGRRNAGRPLAPALRAVRENWIGDVTPEGLLEAVDENPSLRQELGRRIAANGGFVENIQCPDGWSGDNREQRFKNAALSRQVGTRILEGASAAEAYDRLKHEIPAPWQTTY
jgi:hypothetical protein